MEMDETVQDRDTRKQKLSAILSRASPGIKMDLWKIPKEPKTRKSESIGLDFATISFHNVSTEPTMR
jgi:hypothetical protein